MGTRGDNGGERPPDGGGLPNLPPEWGVVVIPDDVSELDHEAGKIRRELRREARQSRWRRRLGLPSARHDDDESPALGLPLLIMSIAIIATLITLFAMAWPGRTSSLQQGPGTSTTATASTLPDLTLRDASGAPVRIRNQLPAVVLLLDGCPCANFIAATAAAAPSRVAVLAVAAAAPSLPTTPPLQHPVRALVDAEHALRSAYASTAPSGSVVVLLIGGDGRIRDTQLTTNIDDFRAELDGLR